MKVLRSLTRLLVRIETTLLVLFLSAMVLLAFAQVVLRNLFDASFLWGDPLVRHLVLWVGFMAWDGRVRSLRMMRVLLSGVMFAPVRPTRHARDDGAI